MTLFIRWFSRGHRDPDVLADAVFEDLDAQTRGVADIIGVDADADGSVLVIVETASRERIEALVREIVTGYDAAGDILVSTSPPDEGMVQ